MEVFRLCREQHSGVLSGKGAALKGARWNSPGTEMIYTSANRSLAMAEVAVHLTLATIPVDYMMMVIEIPDAIKIKNLDELKLPAGWNSFPPSLAVQRIGDEFIHENKCCVLRVPSAVTKGDYNYLINPHHPDFGKINIVSTEKFPFDRRIFRT